ncbi:hypothetical protein H9P43_004720 [Blastocladiella emersonii ATCC 22665]|nr:hypothetical protein H9P43_004720 [Blastocladiella emersonii ATCC 22665]
MSAAKRLGLVAYSDDDSESELEVAAPPPPLPPRAAAPATPAAPAGPVAVVPEASVEDVPDVEDGVDEAAPAYGPALPAQVDDEDDEDDDEIPLLPFAPLALDPSTWRIPAPVANVSDMYTYADFVAAHLAAARPSAPEPAPPEPAAAAAPWIHALPSIPVPSSSLLVPASSVTLPPAPKGDPDPALAAKVAEWARLKAKGIHFNDAVVGARDFGNPALYRSMVEFLGLDEYGTGLGPALSNRVGEKGVVPLPDLLAKQQTEITARAQQRRQQEAAAAASAGPRTLSFVPASSATAGTYRRH